ncbi:DNRLRE domain-containing protein [Paenibacillus ehimensis]|uniref:DNRLRE domain-containing protein n=1 Tax=Paenibacillus ehimensis TaxID=79264 RepID=UPI000FD7F7C0|nr:DNRLRE domain-containing protein [Paenibacillus ehimensis]
MPQIRLFRTEDACVRGDYPDDNYGGDGRLYVECYNGRESYRAYIKFDFSAIPANAIISNATLTIRTDTSGWTGTADNIYAVPVNSDWSEYGITWRNKPDVGWYANYTYKTVSPGANIVYNWDVKKIIQDHVNGSYRTFGIALSSVGERGLKTLLSREADGGYGYIDIFYNTSPNAPGLQTPVHGSITNNRNPVFNWTFSDPDGGDHQTAWQIQVSAGDGGAFTNIVMDSGKNTTATNQWTFYGLGDNQYFYRIRTWDKADAVSPWSWVPWFGIENTPPVAGSITGTQHLNVQPNGTFRVWAYNVKDNWSGVSVVRFPTAGPGYDFQWRDGVKDGGSDNWFCDIPINAYNNNEGTYTTHVYAYDNAGNSGFLGEIKTNVDRTPATIGSVSNIQYTQGSSARVWAADVTDGLSGVDRVTVHVVRPDGSWYFLANAIRDGSSNNYFIDVPLEYEGNWGVDFRAYDRAQNEPVMVRANVIRDNSTPKVTGVQGYSYSNQTGGTRRTWIYGVSDALSGIGAVEAYYVRAGMSWIGPYAAGQSGSDYYFDVPIYSGDGEYAAHFYIRDKAGNQSGPHEVKFFVDSKRANDPNPSVVYGTNSATISWLRFSDPTPSSGYDRTGIWLGEWSGTDWVGGTPNIYNAYEVTRSIDVLETNVSTLKPGARYRYAVAHYDKSGNQSSYTWFEFVTKKKIGEYRTKAGAAILSLPVYDPASGVLGSKALRCGTKSGVGCFELVSPTDPSASPFRIQTHQGIQAIAK